ncbi:hypothetical protein [Burkholderia gladioli]|uniref:hypothetical protein n=1 Tax=Burkholderia gladioli TaxID=28095 RepID=UPI00163E82D8|nr:hypothetical protein [Burkholderia gladioli]
MQVTVAKGKFLDGMSMPGTRQGVKAKRKDQENSAFRSGGYKAVHDAHMPDTLNLSNGCHRHGQPASRRAGDAV